MTELNKSNYWGGVVKVWNSYKMHVKEIGCWRP